MSITSKDVRYLACVSEYDKNEYIGESFKCMNDIEAHRNSVWMMRSTLIEWIFNTAMLARS